LFVKDEFVGKLTQNNSFSRSFLLKNDQIGDFLVEIMGNLPKK
jgi:hypothetical protein